MKTLKFEPTPEEIKMIQTLMQEIAGKDYKPTTDDLDKFLYACKAYGLNPLAKLIYPLFRYDNKAGKHKMFIVTGIDGFRMIGQDTGEYEGQDGPYFYDRHGVESKVWVKANEKPAAARIGIKRKGFSDYLYAVAHWSEYSGTGPIWSKMPTVMIAKCAEALAWRRAFPDSLAGLYTDDEMKAGEPGEAPEKPVKAQESATPVAGEPATLDEGIKKARADWFKQVGGGKKEWQRLVDRGSEKYTVYDQIGEAILATCKTVAEVMNYLENGVHPGSIPDDNECFDDPGQFHQEEG
jgi:phage recombination protein Bet